MRPSVIAFDVNETLSDLSPLAARFVEVGASASLAPLWFASLLRDGFALTATGDSAPFAAVGRELLLGLLEGSQLNRAVEDAADHVIDGFRLLELHPDVAPAVDRLHDAGFRLVTLTNGAAAIADTLLGNADIRDRFEALLSVEEVGAWKPARAAYDFAVEQTKVEPQEVLLVAVHPWDVHGAVRAGLQAAWVDRSERHYPGVFAEPTYTVRSLEELADLW